MPDSQPDAQHHEAAAPAHAEAAAVHHEEVQPAHEEVAPVAEVPAAEHHEDAAPQTVATTEAAPPAVADLSGLQNLAGGNSTVMVILALIAVAGGGAGWKFYQKFSEQKHEQALKKLEIEAQMAGLNGVQPPPCQAASLKVQAELDSVRGELRSNGEAHKKLQEQIDELSQKIAKFEKKAASMFSADFDAEDVEDRLKKIEKALKAKKA